MKTLSHYLALVLDEPHAYHLLKLYPDNDAAKILKAEYPDADDFDLLAAAIQSGAKPILPKINVNKGGRYPAIKEDL